MNPAFSWYLKPLLGRVTRKAQAWPPCGTSVCDAPSHTSQTRMCRACLMRGWRSIRLGRLARDSAPFTQSPLMPRDAVEHLVGDSSHER